MTRLDADAIRDRYARSMTEDALVVAIVEAAKLLHWRVYHVRRSDLGIIQGDGGFPDLVLARDGFVLFLETKSDAGAPTGAQIAWIDALGGAEIGPGRRHVAAVVYPRDLDRVLALLRDAPRDAT